MVRITLVVLAILQLTLDLALAPSSLAQEWAVRRPRGTLRVVDLTASAVSVLSNYGEGLVSLDKDNNLVPCLAEDWRWIDDRTIEFKLRKAVTFHNGDKFDAQAVRVNWEEFKKMKMPYVHPFAVLPDETAFEMIDAYTVRFILPEPDRLILVNFFRWFTQLAPVFFEDHKFDEHQWGYLPVAGPWGTGPYEFVEGSLRYGVPSDLIVLEAYEGYWDREYPGVQRVIFDNTLMGDRKEAMRLCRETEGAVDIVSFIRPLDTLKVAESPFAKVVKSKDVTLLRANFNQLKRDSKWTDVRLRKAVNYAINREELWKYAARGNAYNLEGYLIPPGAYGHNADLPPWTYDTTKARKLLAKAGYPDGFELKVIVPEASKLEALIMKRMLWRIGLDVTLEILTWPEYVMKTHNAFLDKPAGEQDWDIAIFWFHDWFGHTGTTFLAMFTKESGYRWERYDPSYDSMWKDMAQTADSEAQEAKIRELAEYVSERAHIISIYSPLTLYAVNKEVNFVPQKCQFLRLKETSVSDDHWSVREERVPGEE